MSLRLSKDGKNKLESLKRRVGIRQFQTAGIYVCEDTCFTSPDLSRGTLAVEGRVVSPGCFDHLYTKDQTYGSALADFLRTTAKSLHRDSRRPMLLVMSFPEHPSWRAGEEALLKLLDDTFREEPMVAPALVYLSDLLVKKDDLLVQVDKSWTSFTQVRSGRRWQTGVSFGADSDCRNLRLNDYRGNSTAVWQQASFSNWEKAMQQLYGELVKTGWPKDPGKIWIVSKDARYEAVKNALTSGRTVACDVARVSQPAKVIMDYANAQLAPQQPEISQLPEKPRQPEKPKQPEKSQLPKKPEKKSNDPFDF